MATWRDHPYHRQGYLFVLAPAVVFRARINQASFTYPLAQVTFNTVTVGAYTDILPGMTVLFGSTSGGDEYGRQRVRKAASSTVLYVGESSRGVHDGELNLTNGGYITVLNDYRVWGKIPRDNKAGVFYKDYDLTPSDGLHQPLPVANGGPGYAEFVDPDTNVITVDFDGSASFAVASGGSITTYAWDFEDGTPATASTGTVNDVTFPPGFRWVSLTVTDSNSKSHTCRIPVFAAELTGSYAPVTNFEITNQVLTVEGQRISFRIFDPLPETTYPDGTLVMYWEREVYNGAVGSLAGVTGRKHMKFIGWIDTEQASMEATDQGLLTETTLDCIDVAGRLQLLPGFPQIVERDAAPSSWEQLANATIDRYVWYLLQWHSTALDLADFIWSGAASADQSFTRLGSDGGDLYTQADIRTQAIAHRLTCNRVGQLKMLPDPQLLDSADRTVTIITDIDESDWTRLDYTHQRPGRYHWLWGSAIVAGTAEADAAHLKISAVFCVAPGDAPGQGAQAGNQGEQLIQTQAKLNSREGHRYAVRLNPEETFFEIELAHGGDIGIDPASMTWIRLTISAATAAERGLTFTDERFLPFEVAISHDNEAGTKTVHVRAERERVGTPAATYIPPSGEGTFPPLPPVEEWFPGGTSISVVGGMDLYRLHRGVVTMFAIGADAYLYYTYDFETPAAAGGPTWARVSLSPIATPKQWCVDAFCSRYLGTGDQLAGWIATGAKIFRVTWDYDDPAGTLAVAEQFTFSASVTSMTNRCLGGSFGVQNHLVCVTYYPGTGTKATYTTDGTNWAAEVNVTLLRQTGPGDEARIGPGLHVSSKIAGRVYCTAVKTQGSNDSCVCAGYVSNDYGATWAETNGSNGPVMPVGSWPSIDLHVPYHDNPSEKLIYYTYRFDESTPTPFTNLYRTESNGTTVTSLAIAGVNTGPSYRSPFGIVSCPINRLRMLQIRLTNAETFAWVWVSRDGGTTWQIIVESTENLPYAHGAIAGNDEAVIYLWGLGGLIAYSQDFGANIDDRSGNIASFSPGELIGIAGG